VAEYSTVSKSTCRPQVDFSGRDKVTDYTCPGGGGAGGALPTPPPAQPTPKPTAKPTALSTPAPTRAPTPDQGRCLREGFTWHAGSFADSVVGPQGLAVPACAMPAKHGTDLSTVASACSDSAEWKNEFGEGCSYYAGKSEAVCQDTNAEGTASAACACKASCNSCSKMCHGGQIVRGRSLSPKPGFTFTPAPHKTLQAIIHSGAKTLPACHNPPLSTAGPAQWCSYLLDMLPGKPYAHCANSCVERELWLLRKSQHFCRWGFPATE
jgi:hypothetical protein